MSNRLDRTRIGFRDKLKMLEVFFYYRGLIKFSKGAFRRVPTIV